MALSLLLRVLVYDFITKFKEFKMISYVLTKDDRVLNANGTKGHASKWSKKHHSAELGH